MPNPASIASNYQASQRIAPGDPRYDLLQNAMMGGNSGATAGVAPTMGMSNLAQMYAGQKWPMAGYGQGLEANSYNPAMAKPAMVGGGMAPVSKAPYGGGKPSIGSQYGGGKPRIGYGGGFSPNTRAQMW